MEGLDHESSALKLKLQQFAASALEISPKSLQGKLHRTWLSLGGDSLRAVFFMGACDEAGIEVDLPQILQAQSLGGLIDQIARSHKSPEQLRNGDLAENGVSGGYTSEDDEIAAIGPASPMQENMVARQAIEPREYQLQLTVRIASVNPEVVLTTSTVEEAWKAVVDRHAALRTKFVDSVDRPGRLDQAVAREIDPEINIMSISEAKTAFEGYSSDYSHRLSLTQHADNQVLLRLTISHALVDGVSIEIIMRDLFIFLSGTCPAAESMKPDEFLRVQPDTSPEGVSYWTRYMQNAQGSFLSSTSTRDKEAPNGLYTIDKEIAITPEVIEAFSDQSNGTLVNACQVAFALVLRSYTGSNNVCFSYTASGRQKHSKGLQDAAGNFVNTIPCCVELDRNTTIAQALERVHSDYLDSLPYQGASLNGNKDMKGPSVREISDCLLSFQHGMPETELRRMGIAVEVLSWEAPTDYNYTLAISIEKQRVGLRLTTWETVCSSDDALNIVQLFMNSMDFVLRYTNEPWSKFRGLTIQNQQEIVAMNKNPYPLLRKCVHDLVQDTMHRQPDSRAVCAWDGELTYRELCDCASQVAAQLVDLGVKVEDRIGMCMDKSRWAPVVMLGILQAGGVVVPLGNQHPSLHIQTIVRNADISILIADPAHTKRLEAHVASTVTVDDKYFAQVRPPTPSQQTGRSISPDSAAWIVHTSGSTGVPKAVVLEHKALCSPMVVQAARYNMGPWTRALQFSAHTFDVCVKDIFTTLTVGGCVCIPSEEQRLDHLELAMTSMKVNFASLTPTVASLLDPQDLPLLDTLVLTGEALSPGALRPWLDDGHVKVYNAYGPSECSHVSTINGALTLVEDAANIGFPAANRIWVADAADFNRLCPIGAVGELLIEGSIAREYLHDPGRTAAVFVTDPAFVTTLGLQPGRRMYRTGDLVRQTNNGSLVYLGRRDTQIKIRGQRVDVGEIESRISQFLAGHPLVCVDLVQLRNAPSDSSMLIAGIDMHGTTSHDDANPMPGNVCEPSESVIDLLQELDSQLVDCLPHYMVPAHYVPFVSLPMNASGKLDRRRTRSLLEALTGSQLAAFKRVAIQATISTETEKKLQGIWAQVLGCPAADIGGDTHFRHIGGDSVVAMRMAGIARKADISLSVGEIVQHPRLSEMARVVDGHSYMTQRVARDDPLPFSLWKGFLSASAEDQRAQLASVADQCNVHPSEIEDVYPTTALQEGLMVATTQAPETYVAQLAYRLDGNVPLKHFQDAWTKVSERLPILRTRIVYTGDSGSVQVVTRVLPTWTRASDLMSFVKQDRSASFGYGTALHRFAVVEDRTKDQSKRYLVWTAHHSAYDGPTVVRIFSMLAAVYQGQNMDDLRAVTPIPRMIRYLEQTTKDEGKEETQAYWRKNLENVQSTKFPKPSTPSYQPFADGVLRHNFQLQQSGRRVSPAILLRAAWAVVVASHTASDEAMLAVVLSGRDMPLFGIENVVAPTITTVPCRIRIERMSAITAFLDSVDNEAKAMAPHTQLGLANIQRTAGIGHESEPGHLFLVQPGDEDIVSVEALGLEMVDAERGNFEGYALVVECTLQANGAGITVEMRFDKQVLSPSRVSGLLSQLEHVTHQLQLYNLPERELAAPRRNDCIGSLDMISPEDKEKLLSWNRPPPSVTKVSLVELVETQMTKSPDALAVSARDGDLTYSKLFTAAGRLAQQLVALGVGPERAVGLCMEKSKFAVISILAILMARGIVVPLPTLQSGSRLKTIVADADISFALVDITQAKRLKGLVTHLMIVNTGLLNSFPALDVIPSRPEPQIAAWIVYTSGSTGVPKGVVLEHQALCTGLLAHGSRFGITSSTKMLQFSAFTFDLSIQEIFATLAFGGCVCIPSETDRTDRLAPTMRELGVTFAVLTPTVASLLSPESVPSCLNTIVLAGEAVTPDHVRPWLDRITIFNGYGPAECSMFSAIYGPIGCAEDASIIGSPVSNCLWVASLLDHDTLVPVGAEGELLIEGPLLAREYLHDADKTANAFVLDPEFIHSLGLPPGRRVYRTGDVVRQDPDTGLLEYIGRADNQIKIRGQRVEVGEIESHIVRVHSGIKAACVDHVQLQDVANPILIAAGEVCEDDQGIGLATLRGELHKPLPPYMVPTHFVPMTLPVNASGKLDRRATKLALESLTLEQVTSLSSDSRSTVEDRMLNESEEQLSQLWKQVLGVPESHKININDDFFHHGGDSVAAMRLVAAAQAAPIPMHLGVAQILQNPCLVDMAQVATEHSAVHDPAPFDLWDTFYDLEPHNQQKWLVAVAEQCEDIEGPEQIVDVYPATPLQEGLMAITSQQKGAYIAQQVFRMGAKVDIPHLQWAWEALCHKVAILRTRLVYAGGGSLQVVTKNVPHCRSAACELSKYLAEDLEKSFGYGVWLHNLAIVEDGTTKYLVWTAHHAAYDGWSLMQMLRMLVQIYQGEDTELVTTPISRFIRYLQETDKNAMAEYWKKQLEDAKLIRFPQLPSPAYQPHASGIVQKRIHVLRGKKHSGTPVSTPILLRAAWAVTVATYTGADEAIVNIALSGRDAPVPGIADIVGPTITTVPVRILLNMKQAVGDFLSAVDRQSKDMVPFAHAGLHQIRHAVPGFPSDFDAGHLFIIQPAVSSNDSPSIEDIGLEVDLAIIENSESPDFGGYALAVDCTVHPDAVDIDIRFDTHVLPQPIAEALLAQFEHTIGQLRSHKNGTRLADLELLSPSDADTIREWNESAPAPQEACIHELIQIIVHRTPEALAVDAWDGHFSYAALHAASRRLAHYLVLNRGVGPEVRVGMAMDKSRWAIVAILAILIAGGSVVPLATQQPLARLEHVTKDAELFTILVNAERVESLEQLDVVSRRLLVVDAEMVDRLPAPPRDEQICKNVSPDDAAWIVYTSGSTGLPKGVVLEHKALCSSFAAHGPRVGFGPDTRAFQFSAFTFDNCIEDILSVLSYGGCVCVPSETQRLNALAETLRHMQVNLLNCTPTVASLIEPNDVPMLKTLLLGGEPVTPAVVSQWLGHAKIMNTYGPAECSVDVAVGGPMNSPSDASTIGRPLNVSLWVASPSNYNHLVPIGTPGELLVEGPQLAREYLNNPKKTADAFIWDPEFVHKLGMASSRRLYRTGDLVKQNPDGSLIHLGRIDTQIKIRGQRVEIGEIESNILRLQPEVKVACVDLVQLSDMDGDPMLVAAIEVADEGEDSDFTPGITREPTDALRALVRNLQAELLLLLPQYMVPRFIPMARLQLNASGKLDRRATRLTLETMTRKQVASFEEASHTTQERPSLSDMEDRLRQIWVELLSCSPNIGPDDNFTLLGGDSVIAMRHVAAAVRVGIRIGVADILQNPRLSDLARVAEQSQGPRASEADPAPFELWPGFADTDAEERKRWLGAVAQQCGETSADIENVYPATALQEGLMAVTAQQPGAFVAQNVFRMAKVDIAHFKQTWASLMRYLPILRTRIVYHNARSGPLQVVVRKHLHWIHAPDLETYLASDKTLPFSYGTPLHRLAIIEPETADDAMYFVWTQHHSGYDGYQTALMLNMLAEVHQGKELHQSPPPVTRFVRYLQQKNKDEVTTFWRRQLGDVHLARFPELPTPSYRPQADSCSRRLIQRSTHHGGAPVSTLLRAAWAFTVATYTGSTESTSVVALSGRDIPVDGIGSMAMPTLTTVPVRTRLDDREQTVLALLTSMTRQNEEMKPFLHTGMQHIRTAVPALGAYWDPGHLFIIQPPLGGSDEDPLAEIGLEEVNMARTDFPGYALAVQCTINPDGSVDVEIRYDSRVITAPMAENLLAQFEYMIHQLETHPDVSIGDIDRLNPTDAQKTQRWNQPVLHASPITSCVHHLIQSMVDRQPNAPAVCAWDGALSYTALWATSCSLAHYLVDLGVGPEVTVGVCMDKSLWAMVSMLAVLQAGGVVVALGTQHPLVRLKTILADAAIKVTLLDRKQAQRLRDVTDCILVDQDCVHRLPSQSSPPVSGVTPHNAAWIVYTSGSTGTPKGVVLEHQTLCTGIRAHGTRFGNNEATRALQFASHTFGVVIEDMFTTLVFGGCTCIPSEEQKMNMPELANMIQDMDVNFMNLTSTAASLLNPCEVPGVKTVVLGGEALRPTVVQQWAKHGKLLNAYGQSECCVESLISVIENEKDAANIGFPIAGCAAWVVDPLDHNRLVPVDVAGELLIQGPLLARGYLNDPDKTAASFLSNPNFLQRLGFSGDVCTRMYRTGDLVKQNDDGSIDYLGRRDTQIKIRGQRVEAGEIENRIVQLQAEVSHAFVDLIKPSDADPSSDPVLVGAIELHEHFRSCPPTALTDLIQSLRSVLLEHLPTYTVPNYIVPMSNHLPVNASGKLDRRATRTILESMSRDQLAAYKPDQRGAHRPLSLLEERLRAVYAEVLSLPDYKIGPYDQFVQLGGDSVAAMRAVVASRRQGLSLSVRDILLHQTIASLSPCITSITDGLDTLPTSDGVTDVQEWMLNHHITRPDVGMTWFALDAAGPLVGERMADACRQLLATIEVLHTGFVVRDGEWKRAVPALVQPEVKSFNTDTTISQWTTEYIQQNRFDPIDVGRPLVDIALCATGSKHRILISMSHAIYDGMCIASFWSTLKELYETGRTTPLSSFSQYMGQVEKSRTVEASKYWNGLLKNATLTSVGDITPQDREFVWQVGVIGPTAVDIDERLPPGTTCATVLKSAWALVLAKHTGREDVVFADLVSGRAGIDASVADALGMCSTPIPVRVQLDPASTFVELVHAVQEQQVDSMPFETYGFSKIVDECTDWPKESRPPSWINHVPRKIADTISIGGTEYTVSQPAQEEQKWTFSETRISWTQIGNTLEITLAYAVEKVPEEVARRLFEDLTLMLNRTLSSPHELISLG